MIAIMQKGNSYTWFVKILIFMFRCIGCYVDWYYFEEDVDVDVLVNDTDGMEFAGVSQDNPIDLNNIANIIITNPNREIIGPTVIRRKEKISGLYSIICFSSELFSPNCSFL